MNKGRTLQVGDCIGLLAPASPVESDRVEKAIQEVEAMGLRVKVGPSSYRSFGGYLSDTPENRTCELENMFSDPEVNAIWCLRGGYGTPQLLNLLDYSIIAENPKLFIGYSDITALHTAFMQEACLATLHGPMAAVEPVNGFNPLSKGYLERVLFCAEPLGEIVNPPEIATRCLVPGEASGAIVGGNLSLICATLGTEYELDTTNKILFLEDIDEEPSQVDRMLTQLALAGKFSDANAIVLGSWEACLPKEGKESFTVEELFERIIVPFQKPTLANMQIGHDSTNLPLPLGVRGTVISHEGILCVEESLTIE
ncbi:S66 peptidase family protein [Brevibacillus laterosporus]|uniref:S66 peptidase family protein n=1 Tax=Brevibacillus laterosporus TaxID=1465 RepID=UPI000E6C8FBE|nr:LD-carboxypeptidase [Brevibacillus laterosporus]AYB37817.1 LD-carboxypeptidase [Brevibacillus laterosporus]MBG9774784.1 peptidase S66 [Brevibacillus laterosporus]MBM7110120.1 putative murein peptide carboxypeptidase [Brevibacillus laterosporus]NKQ18882.1 LD-carboxypeptidase [Brevibacillus laterosporus]WNX29439.1 LD-carboxypeptidase [Brevibacillus laterosporus]